MLSAEYREFMTPSKYEHLTEFVNAARERDIELKKHIERGERRALDANPSPTKKQKPNEFSKKGNTKGGSPQSKTCGKAHRGECYFKKKPCAMCGKVGHGASNCPGKVSLCYKCYKPRHKKSECPELIGRNENTDTKTKDPKSKATSFHITAAEAKVEPDVISVTPGFSGRTVQL
ncbi:putative transcription factor interactor and regulator CCHC(Zn) family [Helianthus annuus]|uniref:Transcription factor interactor and regulator CCHC(Zn) family n=1 Tax=Helianthus annuus TaxID=4232 RepID=A0A9K3GWR8_HELAN|nr:putative transcription factor interactor and regulator CCHC(Zn) family [Helianthus annuus]KAJ0437093.1 putative transcription factor interactor and regulator CCHC(Zn) family [Helianthus annuus]KAJ0459405.1 putative transcription factor interactor and regulator CCHC(Zn) family [Helianthus annuus]KAJ0639935.1 putative transcription factor interactor and regulator CCHC(Zn) family [Helianthus annuus]KAJ0643892.1 putative transcription factor interactor and regulator CCHC(Zn) family [Helianthus a